MNERNIRSEEELSEIVVRLAEVAGADAIICATDGVTYARRIHKLSAQIRVIAATTNKETYEALTQEGMEAIHLPLRAASRHRQIRHIVSVALKANKISIGNFVLCSIGRDMYRGEGDLIILTDVEAGIAKLPISEVLELDGGIQPKVLEAAISVACNIGRAARRGKRIGAIFMLGDSDRVLEGAEQLIPNPFKGHDESLRKIMNIEIHSTLVELAKLDGAFVVRGDGLIRTAGVFLASPSVDTELPAGLGARYVATTSTTARTDAKAIVVSSTDGNVRAFCKGKLVLQIDPDLPYGPVITDD